MFSSRLQWQLEDNRLTRAVAARRAAGMPVLDLTEANPTRAGFAWEDAVLARALGSAGNGIYDPDPRGKLSAREAVAAYYRERGVTVSPEEIFLTASTSEGYGWLLKLLTDPGDTVLVPAPSYPLLQFLAQLENVNIRPYPLRFVEGRWRVDAAELAAAIDARTKAIFCVAPNNPTGSVLDERDRTVLRDAAQKHGLALLVDEVFLDYGREGNPVVSWAEEKTAPLFVLSGLSKVAVLPQLKLGWIVVAGPEDWRKEAMARLEFVADTYLSVGTPVQLGAEEILAAAEKVRTAIGQRLAANEAAVRDWCAASAHGLELLPREAGWYAVVRLPRGVDEEALAVDLAGRDGVLVHPGYFFDFAPEQGPHLVLSLLAREEEMRTALPPIEEALRRH